MDCPECAKDVYAAAALTDTAREVFRQEGRSEAAAAARERVRGGWLAAWLRPVVAGPVFAALLLVIAYQNVVTIPRVKSASKPQLFNAFSLVGTNVRGERSGLGGEGGEDNAGKIQVQKNETFALVFDFVVPGQKTPGFDHYLCQLQDEAGRVVQQVGIPAERYQKEVHLLVAGGLAHPGKYNAVIAGDPGAKGEWVKGNEVLQFNFVVDFRP
jgi:hypothetical protein